MRQIEVSRTLVFTAPRHARAFFEHLVTGNLGMGRPDEISLIFNQQIRPTTESGFLTQVVTRGVDITVNFFYRHSRIKEYLKDGKALRIETVVNAPNDFGVQRRLEHLPELIARPVTPTTGCCMLNVSVRAVSLRAQPLSGSRCPPPPTARGQEPCGSVTLGSWPWSAPALSTS